MPKAEVVSFSRILAFEARSLAVRIDVARPPRRKFPYNGGTARGADERVHAPGASAMADKVYVVGAYVSNDDPLLRLRAFIPLPTEYRSQGEAVAAAERDYRENNAPGADVRFVVYRAESGDTVVEASRGGPFQTVGFYKVACVEPAETDAE